MTQTDDSSLRLRLRTDTRASHDDLDQVVSRYDLTTRDGFAGFLRLQSVALRSLAPWAARSATRDCITDLSARAERDLRAIGVWQRAETIEIDPPHPLAIDYVIAGSRLGTQVLRKRWLAAENPDVARADAYFSAPSYIEVWKSFCNASKGMPATGDVADQVVCGADRIFKLYHMCALAPHITKGVVHA